MRWLVAVKNNRYRYLLISSGLFAMFLGIGIAPVASAVDTQVDVSVCGQNVPAASIDISQPINDSVVNQSVVTFRGTIANTTQIEISIDGVYSGSLSIGSNQTIFTTDITLSQGTHTVQLTANTICGGADGTDSVVLTYQPAAKPSSGVTTPTEIARDKIEAVANPHAEGALDHFLRQAATIPIIGSAVSTVGDFARAVGLESTVAANGTPAAVGAARVGVTVAALSSIVLASTLAPIAARSVPGVSEVFSVSSHRSMLYLGWVIRGAGVLALALAYLL